MRSLFGRARSAMAGREVFKQASNNVLERRLFLILSFEIYGCVVGLIPSFKIYGCVVGLYEYGPPACAIKANVLSFWHKHFMLEENMLMLEVDWPSVTLEIVLKAFSHVDKFTCLIVKDHKTGISY